MYIWINLLIANPVLVELQISVIEVSHENCGTRPSFPEKRIDRAIVNEKKKTAN